MKDGKQREKKDTATKGKTKRQSGAATSVDDSMAPERDGTGVEQQPNTTAHTTITGGSSNISDTSTMKKKGKTPRPVDLVDLDGEGVAVEYVTVDEARHRALKAVESGTQKEAEKEKTRKKFRVDQDEFSLGSI
jgi:hypothetical protein